MAKDTKLFILMYGLFLGWLLSFLYSGPLFVEIINPDTYPTSTILAALFIIPAITFYIIGCFNISDQSRTKLLPATIGVSLICTVILLVVGDAEKTQGMTAFILAIIITVGIAVMFFIIASTACYTKFIQFDDMFKAMAILIFLANIIVYICDILLFLNQVVIAKSVMVACICAAFYIALKIRNNEQVQRPDYHIIMPKSSLFLICFAFFLLNIGGGVFFETIEPLILSQSKFSVFYYILPYIYASVGVLLLLLLKKTKEMIDIFLTIAAVFITIGLIMFQFSHAHYNLLMADLFIQSGYAILDIFMWGLIGMMAYVYNKAYKIAALSMSSNISAVILGIVGSRGLSLFIQKPEAIVPLIAIISSICAIILIPLLYRITVNDLKKGAKELENEEEKLKKIQKINNYGKLTNREKEVVQYMLLNYTNYEVAKKLFISENTLKTHAKNIYSKLEIKNKRELKNLLAKN